MERTRVVRALRISAAYLSLAASVFLIALWCYSYNALVAISGPLPGLRGFQVDSSDGRVHYESFKSATPIRLEWNSITSSQFSQALDSDPRMQTLKKRVKTVLNALKRQRRESSPEFAATVVDANIMHELIRADFRQETLDNWRPTTNTTIAPIIGDYSVMGIEPTYHFGFSFLSTAIRTSLTFPYWFLVLLGGTFAALFGLRWHMRFSLRAMLIATTLAAIALGIVTTMKHK